MRALLLLFGAAVATAEHCADETCEELIDDPELHLLQRKAQAVRDTGHAASTEAGLHSFTKLDPCEGPVQVLSDVDDTFMSSGGTWPAGCDGVFEKHVVYPGYTQFITELARGPEESLFVLRPALFSARPESFDFLHVDSSSALANALESTRRPDDPAIWDQYNAEIPVVVPENLVAFNYQNGGFEEVLAKGFGGKFGLNTKGSKYGHWTDFTDSNGMGNTKFENFQEIFHEEAARDSSKVCAIFVGDDGQGDCNPAADKMRKFKKLGTNQLGLKAAFIHDLTCSTKPICREDDGGPGAAPLVKFKTYLDAAKRALEMKLISQDGFARVRKAVEMFFAIYCRSDGKSRAPNTVGMEGCEQTWNALVRANGTQIDDETLAEAKATRPSRRFAAWCLHCCNGLMSNGRRSYDFESQSFRCHYMYHTPSWWRPTWGAEDKDCKAHCQAQ